MKKILVVGLLVAALIAGVSGGGYYYYLSTLEKAEILSFEATSTRNSISGSYELDLKNAMLTDSSVIVLKQGDTVLEEIKVLASIGEFTFKDLEVGNEYQVDILIEYGYKYTSRIGEQHAQVRQNLTYEMQFEAKTGEDRVDGLIALNDGVLVFGTVFTTDTRGYLSKYDQNKELVWKNEFKEHAIDAIYEGVEGQIIYTGIDYGDLSDYTSKRKAMIGILDQYGNTILTQDFTRFVDGRDVVIYSPSLVVNEDGSIVFTFKYNCKIYGGQLTKELELDWIKVVQNGQQLGEGTTICPQGKLFDTKGDTQVFTNTYRKSKVINEVMLTMMRDDGEIMWSKQYETDGNDKVVDLLVHNDFIYVIGTSENKTYLSSTTYTAENDSFVMKLDQEGNQIWKQEITESDYDMFNDIAVDQNGNLVIIGSIGTHDYVNATGIIWHINEDGEFTYRQEIDHGGNHLIEYINDQMIVTYVRGVNGVINWY